MHVLPSLGVLEPFESVASFQAFLVSAGRFLLTLAMSLFVSYLVFMIGSVVGSVLSRQVRTLASGIVPGRSDDDARVSRRPARSGARPAALTAHRDPEDPLP